MRGHKSRSHCLREDLRAHVYIKLTMASGIRTHNGRVRPPEVMPSPYHSVKSKLVLPWKTQSKSASLR